MRRQWTAWLAGILAIAAFGLFPLRAALGLSSFERMGFTARQVAGTIWYGRIGSLNLRSQPLGTFEVRLDPFALLIGRISMDFERMDDPQGLLEGQLVAGSSRGIRDTSGRIAASAMFAPLPIEALELSDATVLFRGGQCIEASGRVTPVIATPVPGVQLNGLTGTLQCDGSRARVRMVGGAGTERIEFYVSQTGRYRGWLSVRTTAPEISAALALLGFRPSSQGMMLTVNGTL